MTHAADVKLECFFDCSSPWTYLGFHNLQPLAARLGVPVTWKPILVGGVFNKVNQSLYARRETLEPCKQAYMKKDLKDWAHASGLTINFPPKAGHPVNAVKCMRACIVAQDEGRLIPFATAVFETLWVDGLDLAQDEAVAGACRRAGLDPDDMLARIAAPELKQRLWDNTEELIARGGFGSPTIFVDDTDMYFGNDRLGLVEIAVRNRLGAPRAPT